MTFDLVKNLLLWTEVPFDPDRGLAIMRGYDFDNEILLRYGVGWYGI